MNAEWAVRRASGGDVAAVTEVATAAWTDTYRDLLQPATVAAFLAAAYSPARLRHRIATNDFYVALHRQRVVAFADASIAGDRVVLNAIYALPELRGHGAGTALLRTVLDAHPSLPVTADVLVGNRKGEAFYERRGFVPRETIEADLFGEPVVERRWWRERAPSG